MVTQRLLVPRLRSLFIFLLQVYPFKPSVFLGSIQKELVIRTCHFMHSLQKVLRGGAARSCPGAASSDGAKQSVCVTAETEANEFFV